jgi:hypothetical protein
MDRHYYHARPDTRAGMTIAGWFAAFNAARKARIDFLAKHIAGEFDCIGSDGVLCGVAPKFARPIMLDREREAQWSAMLKANPLWLRKRVPRGCDYLRVGRSTAAQRALAAEWDALPKHPSVEALERDLTGTRMWMRGMTWYHLAVKVLSDESFVLAVPVFVCELKGWQPLAGLERAPDQDAARKAFDAQETEAEVEEGVL